MAEFFGYNPDKGTWYETQDEDGDDITIATMQDVQPVLDHIARKRNSGLIDKGIKNEFWHYATIPASVEVEMKQKGVNIHDPRQTKQMLKMINRDYPKLKNTYLQHE